MIVPPLPRVAPRWLPTGPEVLALLDAEHRELLDRPDPARLVRHLSAEEQYLYPAVRAVLPGGAALAEAELRADAAIRAALRRGGPVEVALRGHVTRCDHRLFPGLRAALDEATRIRLGNRVVIAEEAAPTRPHLGTPCRPPWNRLVEPLVGVLDRVRDAAGCFLRPPAGHF